MKEIVLNLSKRVVPPFLIHVFAVEGYPKIASHVWPWASAVVPSLGELAEFAAFAGIASILAEEVIRHSMIPPAREFISQSILPELKLELGRFRDMLAQGLWEKGLIIRESPAEKDALGSEAVEEEPELSKAKRLSAQGYWDQATDVLTQLAARRPKHLPALLTALSESPRHEDWQRAKALLAKAGALSNYLRLAYNFWLNKEVAAAVAIVEEGYERFQEGAEKASEHDLDRLKNSLAYYYAEAKQVDRADLAKRLSGEVVAHRKPEPNKDLASALATQGYVNITFGQTQEEIADGIRDCEDARRLGAREDLYFRHLARAQERLSALGSL